MSETCMISDFCGSVNDICPLFGFYTAYNPKTVQVSCLKQCMYQSLSFIFWRIIKLENRIGRRKCGWRIDWRRGQILAMTTSQKNWKCFPSRLQNLFTNASFCFWWIIGNYYSFYSKRIHDYGRLLWNTSNEIIHCQRYLYNLRCANYFIGCRLCHINTYHMLCVK